MTLELMPQPRRQSQRLAQANVILNKPRGSSLRVAHERIAAVDRELRWSRPGIIVNDRAILIQTGKCIRAVEIARAQIAVVFVLELKAAAKRMLLERKCQVVLEIELILPRPVRAARIAAAVEGVGHIDRHSQSFCRLVTDLMLKAQADLVNQTRADEESLRDGQSLVRVVGSRATFRQGEVAAVTVSPGLLITEAGVECVLLIDQVSRAQTEEAVLDERRRIGDERAAERPGVDGVLTAHPAIFPVEEE